MKSGLESCPRPAFVAAESTFPIATGLPLPMPLGLDALE